MALRRVHKATTILTHDLHSDSSMLKGNRVFLVPGAIYGPNNFVEIRPLPWDYIAPKTHTDTCKQEKKQQITDNLQTK